MSKYFYQFFRFFYVFYWKFLFFQARYTGFRDRPLHERQAKFQQACREGQIELAVLSNGFTFCLMWNVLENGYLDPHAMTRIDFSKERGRVSRDQFPLFYGKIVFQLDSVNSVVAADDGLIACSLFIIMKLPMMDRETNFSLRYPIHFRTNFTIAILNQFFNFVCNFGFVLS